MVIKTHNLKSSAELAVLREAAGPDDRVIFLNEVYPRRKMIDLIRSCDCFVSLHRAEGFGRLIAEAMFLGKPVVVSDYSGSRQFTDLDNAFLVDGTLIPVKREEYLLGDVDIFEWFDPSIEHAALQMRAVVDDPVAAGARAERGRRRILDYHNAGVLVAFLREHLGPYL